MGALKSLTEMEERYRMLSEMDIGKNDVSPKKVEDTKAYHKGVADAVRHILKVYGDDLGK